MPSAKETRNVKVENGTLPTMPLKEYQDVAGFETSEESTVTITVVGASGDLAKKKIFPALFAPYYEDCLATWRVL